MENTQQARIKATFDGYTAWFDTLEAAQQWIADQEAEESAWLESQRRAIGVR